MFRKLSCFSCFLPAFFTKPLNLHHISLCLPASHTDPILSHIPNLYCSPALCNPAWWGCAKISTPSPKLGLGNLHSLPVFLATFPWLFLHCRSCHLPLHELCSPSPSSPESCRHHTPSAAHSSHGHATRDSWFESALSCFPKPKSKSSDQARHRVRPQSALKVQFCTQAPFAEGKVSTLLPNTQFLNRGALQKYLCSQGPSYHS